MRCRPTAAMLLAGLIVVTARAAEPRINYLDPPQGLFSDDWMTVELSGEKAGYAHSTMTRQGDEIATHSKTYFKLGRADQVIEVTITQSTRETLAGEPRTFETVTKMGSTEVVSRGGVENGEATITNSQFGFDTKQKAKVPAGARMAWGLFRASIEHGFAAGTTYELDVYEPLMLADAALKAKVAIGEHVKIDIRGKPTDAVKVTTSMQFGGGSVDSISYIDERGQVLRAETSLGGFEMTLTSVDMKTALQDFAAPEFFVDTLITVDQAIDRETAKSINYELRVEGVGRKLPELPATAMQAPKERKEQSARIEVHRLDREAMKAFDPAPPDPAMAEYLAATSALNIQDEAVSAMAKSAAEGESRPYALADRLRVYVSNVIQEKNLTVGFATASEVCRHREGDCTEHAVLLAALGRAQGLPSRVVVGLAYLPEFAGRKNVFGFHMWTQFHIAGQWVDFDAALRETDCSPARIALAVSSLKDASVGDIAFPIIDVIRGLEIKIKSIESR